MKIPALSIITVNMNNADGLLRTIESVLGQSRRDFEFLVIDGGSTDKSPDIIKRYEKEFHYCISEKDSGIYHAMNKGIQHSTGRYLLFLNSGDWLADDRVFETILPFLKDYDVISGNIDIYDAGQWHAMSSDNKISVELFIRLSLYHQATFISRSLFNTFGLYDETFRSTGDYEFFIRTLLKNNGSYFHAPVKISKFITDGMSNDKAFARINQQERVRSWQMNFSENIISELNAYYQLINSRELALGRKLSKLIP